MARIEKRKRELEWWREASEDQFMDGTKLTEAYDPSRLTPGYDGRNGPDVKQMYAKKKDARFDDMGADGGTKTKKGDADKADVNVKESKHKVREADFGNEPKDNDFNDEVPPEMDNDEFNDEGINDHDMDSMDDEGMEGDEHADEVADDVHIEIDGQRFRLVPENPEDGEDEEDFDNEGLDGGDELEGHDQSPEGMGVEAEDKDVEFPESRKVSKKVSKKTLSEKAATIKKLIAMKNYAESQLKELFTGDYVTDKQGLSGLDFSKVRGDKDYAVVARAASGDQYTATNSESPYEPGKDAKGQTGGGKVQKTAAPSKESFKAWLRAEQKKMREEGGQEDPGKTSEDFNIEDDFESNGLGNDYANKPEEVGAKEDVITKVDTQKTNENVAKRLAAIKRTRETRRTESVNGKAPVQAKMEEEFDFKRLMNGGYTNVAE